MRTWSARSKRNMQGLHPDLIIVLTAALQLTPFDFVVTEGLRSEARQRELVNKGASKTMNSRHLTGHAFDIAVLTSGGVTWEFGAYEACAEVFKKVAADLGIDLEWGGDWRSFKDGPHFQLSWDKYPKGEWVTWAEPKERTLTGTRTVQGGMLATGGTVGSVATELAADVTQAAADVSPLMDYLPAMKWVFVALTLLGIGLTIYARWDDRRAGHH